MPDIAKWSEIWQWLAGVGTVVGGIIAGFLGHRIVGKRRADDDPRGQLREDERRRVELESQVADNKVREDFQAALGATRKSFFDEFAKLETRVRVLEIDNATLNSEVDRLSEDRWQKPHK